MKKYRFIFNGRQSGAIGIFYKIADTYEAATLSEAKSLLYEDYEHIRIEKMTCGTKEIDKQEFDKAEFVPVRSHRTRPRDKDKGAYFYFRSDSLQ